MKTQWIIGVIIVVVVLGKAGNAGFCPEDPWGQQTWGTGCNHLVQLSADEVEEALRPFNPPSMAITPESLGWLEAQRRASLPEHQSSQRERAVDLYQVRLSLLMPQSNFAGPFVSFLEERTPVKAVVPTSTSKDLFPLLLEAENLKNSSSISAGLKRKEPESEELSEDTLAEPEKRKRGKEDLLKPKRKENQKKKKINGQLIEEKRAKALSFREKLTGAKLKTDLNNVIDLLLENSWKAQINKYEFQSDWGKTFKKPWPNESKEVFMVRFYDGFIDLSAKTLMFDPKYSVRKATDK